MAKTNTIIIRILKTRILAITPVAIRQKTWLKTPMLKFQIMRKDVVVQAETN